ncbi:hypothetical protein ACVMB1_005041 [Bradyrhizobium sp. USDA 4504]
MCELSSALFRRIIEYVGNLAPVSPVYLVPMAAPAQTTALAHRIEGGHSSKDRGIGKLALPLSPAGGGSAVERRD